MFFNFIIFNFSIIIFSLYIRRLLSIEFISIRLCRWNMKRNQKLNITMFVISFHWISIRLWINYRNSCHYQKWTFHSKNRVLQHSIHRPVHQFNPNTLAYIRVKCVPIMLAVILAPLFSHLLYVLFFSSHWLVRCFQVISTSFILH